MSIGSESGRKQGLGIKSARNRPGSKDMSSLWRLLPYLFRYPWRFGLTMFFLLIAALAALGVPAMAGRIIDKGFVEKNLDKVGEYGLLALGLAAVMAIASGARFYFVAGLGERVLTDLRKAVFEHLLALDTAFFDKHRVGELTARLSGDVVIIRAAIGSNLSMSVRGIVTIIGALVLMALTSPYLTLAVVVVVPMILLPVLMVGRRLRNMSRKTQDRLADMSAMASEAFSSHRTIRSFGQETLQAAEYAQRAEASFDAEVKRLGARARLLGVVMFLATAALVALIWWGARAVFDGAVTAGQLAQFTIYALMASNAFSSISETFGTVQQVAGAMERLNEILDTKPSIVTPEAPKPLPLPALGTVAFENVRFSYHARDDETIIDGVSFAVARGETVALVGSSGSGKSTLLALVQRFYDVTGGRILVDGIDIREVAIADLRSRFAYVEQEPTIFAGTIAENIRFGRPDASEADIEAASRAALVHDFVTQLPNGYQSMVGERGVMLSGGQKQRVAIARALLKNAPILLLDEATSALDAESERLVQVALDRLMEGRTTLVIAHRLATIRDANRIVVMEKGRVIDQGTHDELVRKGGKYAELAKLQFRAETLAAE